MIPDEIRKEILNKPLNAFNEVFWDYLSNKCLENNLSEKEVFDEIAEYNELCAIRSKRYEKEKRKKYGRFNYG